MDIHKLAAQDGHQTNEQADAYVVLLARYILLLEARIAQLETAQKDTYHITLQRGDPRHYAIGLGEITVSDRYVEKLLTDADSVNRFKPNKS